MDIEPPVRALRTLFVYGSLEFPEVVRALVGRWPEVAPATLPGYRRRMLQGRDYPAVVPDPSEAVQASVIVDVAAAEWAVLDAFEGPEYERVPVAIQMGAAGGRSEGSAEAFVYRFRSPLRGELGDEVWDAERFRSQHLDTWVASCEALARELRAELSRRPGSSARSRP